MIIDIYRSNKNSSKFLSVPAGTDVKLLNLPENTDTDLLDLILDKSNVDICDGDDKPRIALDHNDIISQINANGYAIHRVTVTVTVTP